MYLLLWFLYQWLKLTADDVKEQIYKLAKKGLTPSQIGQYKTSHAIFMQEIKDRIEDKTWLVICFQTGVILRDSHGVAQVRYITGNKILRILKAKGTNFCSKTQVWYKRGANIWVVLEVKVSIFIWLLCYAVLLFI